LLSNTIINRFFLALLLISLFIAKSTVAQSFKFGGKTGINFSNFVWDGSESFDVRTTFRIGAVAQVNIDETLGVQAELLYSPQGAKFNNDRFDAIYKLDYIILPVLMNLNVGSNIKMQVGPQFGFLVNEELDEDTVSVVLQSEPFEFAVTSGVQYSPTESDFFFQARYTLGLTNVLENDIRHSIISLSVGYFFL
jgi:hypothetical protein